MAFAGHEAERIREALLEEARRCAVTLGMRKTSVEQLTQAAGISKGSFYKFFDSKETLFFCVLEGIHTQVYEVAERALRENGGDAAERAARAILAACETLSDSGAMTFVENDADAILRKIPDEIRRVHYHDDEVHINALLEENALIPRAPKTLVAATVRGLILTVLHQALRKIGVESIHGTMPVLFRTDTLKTDTSALSLRDALFGEIGGYRTPPHAYNRPGRAEGRLVGGNLSLIYALNGTDLDNDMDEPSVLFIEDVGENIYHIDRMMQNLKRSGKLARAKAVVVGYFNKMKFEKEWGADAEALINAYTASLGVPVIFGFPAGHASPNMSLYMGRRVSVVVTPEGAALEFL